MERIEHNSVGPSKSLVVKAGVILRTMGRWIGEICLEEKVGAGWFPLWSWLSDGGNNIDYTFHEPGEYRINIVRLKRGRVEASLTEQLT